MIEKIKIQFIIAIIFFVSFFLVADWPTKSIDSSPYQQIVTVAKAGGDYTTIQEAIDGIGDATSDKQYCVHIYPGEYNENITMKDYVHLDGQGATPREVMISSDTGTVVTWNTSGISHIHNITIESTPVASTAKLVNISAGTHALERCLLLMNPSNTFVTGVTVSGGIFYFDKSAYYYTMTGTAAGINNQILMATSGGGTVHISYNLIMATIPDADDSIKIIDEATTGNVIVAIGDTIASASPITIGAGNSSFVSGTADIDSIVPGERGQEVKLIFTGSAASNGVVDGKNLKIAGNFAYSADDILHLICDGSDWIEINRSAN